MKIHSIGTQAVSSRCKRLEASTTQDVFRIWVFPFYRADVTLTTVLQLTYDKSSQRYFIASQNDLYQVNQFLRFVAPFGADLLVWLWQVWATFFCLLGTLLMWPITLIEETVYPPGGRPPSARLSG
ncbi:hypothetical protein LTR16_001336 [Cryomyces antarcticus]|uniref:SigF-like NTF2-like domain-containing protein n=1 Tax=Cryomyces antarcticus TaxID=329879 RepID=A0ABR0M875_9PEZI|nr:hypothetical protein LTR16_001336 [Cryomyces antarcticus]